MQITTIKKAFKANSHLHVDVGANETRKTSAIKNGMVIEVRSKDLFVQGVKTAGEYSWWQLRAGSWVLPSDVSCFNEEYISAD